MKNVFNLNNEFLKISKYRGEVEPHKCISGSNFNSDLLMKYLRIKHGIIEDDKIGANTMGSIFHVGLEELKHYGIHPEISSSIMMDDFRISCTTDIIDDKQKVIADSKLTKRYTLEKFDQDGDYAWQLRFNKWLLNKTNDDKYKDYDLYCILWIKNFENTFKQEAIEPIHYVEIVDHKQDKVEDRLLKYIKSLTMYIDSNQYPDECSDLWWRNRKNKVTGKSEKYPSRCEMYCSYNKVCPYYKERYKSIADIALNW